MTFRVLMLFALVFGSACGDDDSSFDAGQDDTGMDLGTDAAVLSDVGPDTIPPDGGVDDGGVDDGGVDGGTAENPWTWCPGQDAYRGDPAWTQEMTTLPVMRCVGYSEGGTLADSRAGKMRAWIVPGDYGVPPRQPGNGEFALPICTEIVGGQGPAMTGSGSFTILNEGEISTLTLTTELAGVSDFEVSFRRDAVGLAENEWADDLILNGEIGSNGAIIANNATRVLQPCDLNEGFELHVDASFEGGSVSFSYRGIAGSVSTGPAGTFHVTGMIDGESIDITDYFRIFYVASHHHFGGGAFAVLFDSPIRGACGFRMDTRSSPGEAMLIDCDLATVEVLDATFEMEF